MFNAGRVGISPPISLEDYVRLPHVLTSLRKGERGVVDTALAELGLTRTVALTTPRFVAVPFLVAGSPSSRPCMPNLRATSPPRWGSASARPRSNCLGYRSRSSGTHRTTRTLRMSGCGGRYCTWRRRWSGSTDRSDAKDWVNGFYYNLQTGSTVQHSSQGFFHSTRSALTQLHRRLPCPFAYSHSS